MSTPRTLPREVAAVASLFLLAIVAYLLLVRLRVGPFVDNDEYIYGNLAQSIAAGEGRSWRGQPGGLNSIYPYLIAPAWVLANGNVAFNVAKAIDVVVMCSMVWPVWLVSRRLIQGRGALIPPALLLLGVWMEYASKIMSEALALPATTFALCAWFFALRARGGRWFWAGLAAATLATLSRPQLGVLFVVLAAAFALDVVRGPREAWSARMRERRVPLAVCWGIVVVGAIVVIGPERSWLGDYGDLLDTSPPVLKSLRWTIDNTIELALMVGVIPLVASAGLLLSRSAWRDDVLGPFLAVLSAALIVLLPLAGWFDATVSQRLAERYIAYVAPLLLIGLVPGLRLGNWRRMLGVTAALVLATVAMDAGLGSSLEAPALDATARLVGWDRPSAIPLAGVAAVIGLLGLVAVAVGAAWWVQRDQESPVRTRKPSATSLATAAALAIVVICLVDQSRWQWHEAHRTSRYFIPLLKGIPDDVDARVAGEKTIVSINFPSPLVLETEFFNKHITRAVVAPAANVGAGYGPSCPFKIRPDGSFIGGSACGVGRRPFVFLSDPRLVPTLVEGGPALATSPNTNVVVGLPRFVAVRTPLCAEDLGRCTTATIKTWATAGGTLVLRFNGGQSPHRLAVNGKIHLAPAASPTTIRVPVAGGPATTQIQPDWQAPSPDVPVLVSATLVLPGRPQIQLN